MILHSRFAIARTKGAEIVVFSDADGEEAARAKTDEKGQIKAMLPEYRVSGKEKTICSAYTAKAGGKEQKVTLDRDKEVVIAQ